MHGSAWMFWLVAALALAAVEAVTVDFIFLMLAIGCLAGGAASLLGASLPIAAIIAAAVSLTGLAAIRPALRQRLRQNDSGAKFGIEAVTGRCGHVIERIDAAAGLVSIDGDRWSARSFDDEPIDTTERIRVVRVDGATLIVEPVPHPYA